jgi:membrane-associated protease RseP (regulator of RpoE activity)
MRLDIIKSSPFLNILLFVATAFTTTLAGAFYADKPSEGYISFFLQGWVFSVPLMAILLVHEMGHYLSGRRHHLDVSLPYFIPAPVIFPLGTFGALIKIRSLIPNRRVLVQIGAAGPVSGGIVAIPLLAIGLALSEIRPLSENPGLLSLGSSLIFELGCLLRFGQFSFDINVVLHPTAVAAWAGLFVTALNMLPIGQLDGGHVIYGLFGHTASRVVSIVVLVCLIPVGVFLWVGWLVFGAIILVLGPRHPPPLDPYTSLDWKSRFLGWTAIVLFVLTFMPIPVSFVE